MSSKNGVKEKVGHIGGLPSGVGVSKVKNGLGSIYWKVRLGSRFTGAGAVIRQFPKLEEARVWVRSQIDRKSHLAVSALSPERLGEAVECFKRLEDSGMSLSSAVDLALKFSKGDDKEKTLSEVSDELLLKK